MANNEYNIGSLRIVSPTSTKMLGDYIIMGTGENLVPFFITVKETANVEATVTARQSLSSDLGSKVDVREVEHLGSTLTIKRSSLLDLSSKLTVTPKNKMFGQYEVIKPTPIEAKIKGLKDTYTRSNRPRVNYGNEESILIGNNYGDLYETYIQYDINKLPKNKVITKAEIVLVGIDSSSEFNVNIRRVLQEWDEYSTTWNNSPPLSPVEKVQKSGSSHGEVRLDVTELVLKWYGGEVGNYGVNLSKEDTDEVGAKTYGSRESLLDSIKHYLSVQYLDPQMYSYNQTYTRGAVTVRPYKDLSGKLNVIPNEWNTDVHASFESTLGDSIPVQILVNTPNIKGTVNVKYRGAVEWDGSLTVYDYEDKDLIAGQIDVVELHKSVDSTIYVKYNDDTASSIKVIVDEYKDTSATVSTRVTNDVESAVTVHQVENTQSTINVKRAKDLDIQGKITVTSHANVDSSVEVKHVLDIGGSVSVRVDSVKDIQGTLHYHYTKDAESTITVTPYEDIASSITVRIGTSNDYESKVDVKDTIDFINSLTVRGYHDLPTEIDVKYVSQNDLSTNLDVIIVDYMPCILTVTHDSLEGSVTAAVSDLKDIVGSVAVRKDDYHYASGNITPRLSKTYDMGHKVTVRADKDSSWGSRVLVRESDTADLFVTIDVEGIPRRSYVFLM